jgi:outer membrane biosynthesis protein TonB
MNNQTQGKPKAASMSSLLARKGDAAPAPDMQTRAVVKPAETVVPPALQVVETKPAAVSPEVVSVKAEIVQPVAEPKVETPAVVEKPAQEKTTVAIPSAAVGLALGDMLRQIADSENLQKPVKVSMVPVNMKLPSETIEKLKKIVGIEQYRRGNNFSQQNYLESRVVALIDLEYAALPKI